MSRLHLPLLFALLALNAAAEEPSWSARMNSAMPDRLTVDPGRPRTALVFSASPGYKHDVIPQVKAVFQTMEKKTGVCTFIMSDDVSWFESHNLKTVDAVILNNTCSDRKERHLFRDMLIHQVDTYGGTYAGLSETERNTKAAEFEQNLLDYVADGHGLMVVHGGIVCINRSPEISSMIGGSFDFHPPFQEITLEPVEPDHPLLKGFRGQSFTHQDEPYIFKGAYTDKSFRPLLQMDVSKLRPDTPERVASDTRYVSWIKPHGKGRVFFSSPSHGAESYTRPELLQFYLDGLQYALGDLPCDDSTP